MEALRNQIDLSFLNSSDKKWITDRIRQMTY